MNKRTYLLSFLFMIVLISIQSETVFAQLVSNKRLEIVSPENVYEEHLVLNYHNNGIVILNPQSDIYNRNHQLNISKLDTALIVKWHISIPINQNFKFIKYCQSENYVFCLMKKEDKNDIQIYRIDLNNGDYIVSETRLLTYMTIDFFKAIKNKVLFGGRFNDKPVIEFYNLVDKNSKVLPGVYSNNQTLNSIEIDEVNLIAYVSIQSQRNCKYFINAFDYDGKFLFSRSLNSEKLTPLNSKLFKINNLEDVFAGNYTDNCSHYSAGFYTYSLEDSSKTRYYNFDDLTNYYKYLPEKRAEKLKSKVLKKKEKGKNTIIRNRILLHDILNTEDGFYIIGEIFYPSYYTNRNLTYSSQNLYTSNKYFNNEYNYFKYSHAVICKFNNNGKMEWNYSVDLKNIETGELNEKIQVIKKKDNIILAYPDGKKIITEIINNQETTLKEEYIISADNPKITDTYLSELTSWYDYKFLSYGYQKSKPNSDSTNEEDIFYLEIISYQNPNSN